MIHTPDYEVELRIDGVLLGNIRPIAQNLKWRRCRTVYGVDEIDFILNDKLFAAWCEERNTDINQVLRPLALDARIIRDGEEIVGGFLATMPAYQPQKDSANLQLRFDGYLNLLQGVYIRPTPTIIDHADQLVKSWIDDAESRAIAAGKGFGLTAGNLEQLGEIQETFDNYKTVKEAIVQRADNIEGAGPFDLIFRPDRTYDITSQLGRDIISWELEYPMRQTGQGIMTITAPEVQGFASHIIALGSGEVSSDPEKSTVIISEDTDTDAVQLYGYAETLNQYSSVSRQTTLDQHCATDLYNAATVQWQPQITLSGEQTPPSPSKEHGLWIGDTVYVQNNADLTGQTSGHFRVNTITVSVSSTNAETITPALERIL